MLPPRVHNLNGNAAERSPRRVVCLDTETSWTDDGEREHHTLRLWVARLLIRAGDPKVTQRDAWARGTTGAELVDTLEAWNRTSATTWVFAHNLTVDLCTTRIVTGLLGAGWTLGQHALANDSPWARLSRGRRRITLVDSATWLPQSIAQLGAWRGTPKPDLPANAADAATWDQRCTTDVRILSEWLEELLDYWDRHRLGCWSVTGTATAWNMYRHHPEPTRPVIDPDPEARAFERRAIAAGRRECWRVGQLRRGRYIMIDLELAHLTAARCFPLPIRRSREFARLDLDDPRLTDDRWSPLAEVTIRTSTPRYPCRLEDRIWHPVGTFRTTLAGPEIQEARRRGELVAVHRGYLYRLGPTMLRWAHHLHRLLAGAVPDTPPAAHVFAKMASRRVMGKWAARTSREVDPFPSTETRWKLERGVHHPSDARCSIIHLDGTARVMVHDQEADDAFPAVLAWIQSHVRVALGRLVDALDPARRVSCNTDGVLYAAQVDPDLAALAGVTAPFLPRIKAVYTDVDVVSAAHLVLDGHNRLSGVPSSASPTGETSLAWTTWPRMRRQLELGAADGYVREHREVDLAKVPVPRWVLTDSTTRPISTCVDSLGTTRVIPFCPGVDAEYGLNLAEPQHPMLTSLIAEAAGWPDLTTLAL